MARSADEVARKALQLNRHLFLRDGDAFARELARYIRSENLVIGKEALKELVEAAMKPQPRA